MEIKMFREGKMNRRIIIQMQSYATQSLGVKCANASLRAGPPVETRSGNDKHPLVAWRGVATKTFQQNTIIVVF